MDGHLLTRPGLLLEREGQLRSIERLIEAAGAASGRCVLVEAAPGLGKSRLVATAGKRAGEAGMQGAPPPCSALGVGVSFGAALPLFEPLLGGVGSEQRRGLLTGAAALTEPLFEPSAPDADDDQAFSVFHGLHWLAAGLAERAPLL